MAIDYDVVDVVAVVAAVILLAADGVGVSVSVSVSMAVCRWGRGVWRVGACSDAGASVRWRALFRKDEGRR